MNEKLVKEKKHACITSVGDAIGKVRIGRATIVAHVCVSERINCCHVAKHVVVIGGTLDHLTRCRILARNFFVVVKRIVDK